MSSEQASRQRYFLRLGYDGSAYSGWQTQAEGISTVQSTLQLSLKQVLGYPVHLHGCGRTDAGVHATGYVAHFDAKRVLPKGFLRALNLRLPDDIAVADCWAVAPSRHAQRSALSRTYEYRVGIRKAPFQRGRVGRYHHYALNVEAMRHVADLYAAQTDFRAFCRRPDQYPTTVCRIDACTLTPSAEGTELVFRITANRFLHNMVRLLVARMVDVGRGALRLDALEEAFATGEAVSFLRPAPAEGLYLVGVAYRGDGN